MSKPIEIQFGDLHLVTPTGHTTLWVIDRWKKCLSLSRAQQTVIDLLFAGFSLLFFVGCSQQPALTAWQLALREADNAILSTTEATHSTVKEQTAKLDAIATKLDTLEASLVSKSENVQSGQEVITESVADTSPDKNAQDSQTPAQGSSAESGDVPLFVSVAPFCAPCEALKKDFLAGKLKGFDVKFCVQTEAHRDKLIADGIPADRIVIEAYDATPFPAIRYKSDQSVTGWKWHTPRGYGPRILMELRSTLLGEKTPYAVDFPQAQRVESPVMSQGDLISLHNSLHGGGSWTWPGDLAEHLRNTHGVQIDGTASYYSGSQIVRSRNVVRSFPQRQVVRGRQNFVSRSACPTCPR